MSAAAHLRALAAEPRPAGSEAAARARAYCNATLGALGFHVAERPFTYSAVVGELGTPLGGLLALAVVGGGALAGYRGHAGLALVILVAAAPLLALGGRWLARRGVLVLPFMRRRGVNLEAVRSAGDPSPSLWLVAHIDSKSQPVPLIGRAAGIMLVGLVWIAAIGLAAAQLAGRGVGSAWGWLALVGVIGALPVIASTVGRRSAGAIDNASGVATVLEAAALIPERASIGVLITDAEELGLAGARAWCAERGRGVALNCDGVDDDGILTLMWTRPRAPRLERALRDAAGGEEAPLRIIPLVPGVLVDGVAFADSGWEVITVSRGTVDTLLRIHTRRDSTDALRGDGVTIVARVIARAAQSLLERA